MVNIFLVIAVAMLVLATIGKFYANYQKKCEHQRLEAKKAAKEKQLAEYKRQQNALGDDLLEAFSEAARANVQANWLNGKPAPKVSLIQIWWIRENGDSYSIMPIMLDPSVFNGPGHYLMQISITVNEKGTKIHALHCPYGPERTYSGEQYDYVKHTLCEYIRRFRLYGREGCQIENDFDHIFRPAGEKPQQHVTVGEFLLN